MTHPNSYRKGTHLKKGFSLVEVMVYISVTVLVSFALITTFLSFDTVLLRNRTERELMQSGSASLERMVRSIRSADSINAGLSTFGTSPGALALTEGGMTTRFYLSSGDLMVSINGAELGPLTSSEVTVQNLTFHRYTGSTTEMVRVMLTLSATSKASSSTRAYTTSAVLRGSYE